MKVALFIFIMLLTSFLTIHESSGSGSSKTQFGYCGGMPSGNQALTNLQKKKAMKILKSASPDSIKNNCMDCHAMVSLVSSMSQKERKKWFKGIKYLREVIEEMKKG